MSKRIRSAKSASDWTEAELKDYDIEVHSQSPRSFFGHTPTLLPDVDQRIYNHALPGPVTDIDAIESPTTYRTLASLDLATGVLASEESSIDSFVSILLQDVLGFQRDGTFLRFLHRNTLRIAGDFNRSAEINVCLIQYTTRMILILCENKTRKSSKKPEPQLIAETIAAFQNNAQLLKDRGYLAPLSMTFPALTMVGTSPTFYKITVTQALSAAIVAGEEPPSKTVVYKTTVPKHSDSEGMDTLRYRKDALIYFAEFRELAERFYSEFYL